MKITFANKSPEYGKLPKGWSCRRLRFDASLNPKKSEALGRDDEAVSFVPMEAIGEHGGIDTSTVRRLGDVSSGYTYFSDDDVLVAKITPCFENGKGAIAEDLTNGIGFGTTELHVLRSGPNLHPRFLFYITMSDDFRKIGGSEMYGAGGQKRVPENFVKNWTPPLPSDKIQRRISGFLDQKTQKIDSLIEKKKALLNALFERRQALIANAVTKGLDKSALMKPSGIAWLGEVPRHWEILPLKRMLQSSDYGISASLKETGSIAVLRMGNPSYGQIHFSDLRYVEDVNDADLLLPDDVVFNRTNSLDQVGKAAIFRGYPTTPVTIASYLVRFRFNKKYTPEFANFVMMNDALLKLSRTLALPSIGHANLNPSRYSLIEFPIPPVDEQKEISCYLRDVTGRIDKSVVKVQKSIDFLKEFRSQLITSAITGKLAKLEN